MLPTLLTRLLFLCALCQVMGRRAFVGINFLSRTPITSEAELQMYWRVSVPVCSFAVGSMEVQATQLVCSDDAAPD
jgi:hypothetical protein